MSISSGNPKNYETHLQTILKAMHDNEAFLMGSDTLPLNSILAAHKKQAELTGAMMWLQNLINNKAGQALIKPVPNNLVSLP